MAVPARDEQRRASVLIDLVNAPRIGRESERELLLRCKRLCTEKLRALEVPATPLQLSQPDAELFV